MSERREQRDDLQVSLDRAVEALLAERLGRLDRRARPRGGHIVAAVFLNLGLVGLGIAATAAAGAALQGPGGVIIAGAAWLAILGIGVTFSQSLQGPKGGLPAPPKAQPVAAPPPRAPAPAISPAPAPALQADPVGRLPLTVRVKVEQIRRKAEMLLEQREHFPLGSRQLFVLRRIQEEYLPSTISVHEAFSGDDRPVTPDGRTALRVLRDQLDLLDKKLDEIAEDLQRQNADRLLANERFLEEHFGQPQLPDPDLRLP